MLTKKLRSFSMVCLALVMALSLCFGIANFSNVKSASAAASDTTVDANNVLSVFDVDVDTVKPSSSPKYKSGTEFEVYLQDGKTKVGSYKLAIKDELSKTNNSVTTNGLRWAGSSDSNCITIKSEADYRLDLVMEVMRHGGDTTTRYFAVSSINKKATGSNGSIANITCDDSTIKTIDTRTVETLPSTYYVNASSDYCMIHSMQIVVTPLVTKYNVSFDTDGGNEIEAQTVAEGEFAQAPVNPEKTGYNFVGWAVNGVNVDLATYAITADTTFTAVWELDASFVKPEITAFDAVSNVEINFGTAKEDIALPTQVTSGEYSFPVTWSWDKEYDASAVQNYTLTGNVEVDEAVYTVSAQAPTMQVIVNEVAVEGGAIEGTFYTFDNATIANLPSVWTENGVDFEIDWNAYVADSATISGSLVAKTGYDVSNAQVTANVQKAVASKSINFINDGVNDGAEYNSVLEAAGYSVTGTWTYEKSKDNVTADNIEYMGIKGALATITMFLDKPAIVTIAAAGNSSSALVLDGNITVKSGTQAVMVKSYELEAGAHTLESTVSGKNIFIKFINIQYEDSTSFIGYSNSKFSAQSDASATLPLVAGEKAGYEFIGWSNGNGVYAPGADITEAEATAKAAGNGYMGTLYTAVYAKAEYLGVQFKTAGNGAIRFGFMISAVNAGDEAVALSADLLSDATFTFVNLSNGMSANLVPTTLKVGSDETNLYTNLAITGMDAAKSANVLTANLSIKVNGVAIEVNGSETESITAKAQKALEAGQLNQDQAGVYGA